MNSRIREIRKALGLTQREFAEKIGLQHNAVSVMERSNSKIPEYYIFAICFQYKINEDWLRTGQGEMFQKEDPQKERLMSLFDELTPPCRDHLVTQAAGLLALQTRLTEAKRD